ncbi:MAG: hypothetical protein MUE46_09375 [Xanthomonadales bacterium]|jgi:hypothetical protein|nr:hypothetical protein [Xanthomonadales bacterium]
MPCRSWRQRASEAAAARFGTSTELAPAVLRCGTRSAADALQRATGNAARQVRSPARAVPAEGVAFIRRARAYFGRDLVIPYHQDFRLAQGLTDGRYLPAQDGVGWLNYDIDLDDDTDHGAARHAA